MNFVFHLYAGAAGKHLVGIYTAQNCDSDTMLRLADWYRHGGHRVEVWHGSANPAHGTLCHITI